MREQEGVILLCCAPYHKGKAVPTAALLLISRFSAYAMNLPHFIIETTHAGQSRISEGP